MAARADSESLVESTESRMSSAGEQQTALALYIAVAHENGSKKDGAFANNHRIFPSFFYGPTSIITR
jgi:hypothetical protein